MINISQHNAMDSLTQLIDIINRHAPGDGTHASAIPGLCLLRSAVPTMPMPVVYEPTFCVIAQGRKQVMLGNNIYVYDPANYLLASVDLPVVGSVIEATPTEPYLSFSLALDTTELADLALRFPASENDRKISATGMSLNPITPNLLEVTTRLLGLLDAPADIAALAPLFTREILYRLLTGPGNSVVRQMAHARSRLSQISKAINWIKLHYTKPCRIEEMADIAGMSRSTFHTHFKIITAMSPLEYRTQLRLQEARRLLVSEAMDSASAGFRVGYESPSQFSRDYARLFGAPPVKDTERLRAASC